MEVPLTEKGKTKRMGDGRGYQLSFGHVKFEISIKHSNGDVKLVWKYTPENFQRIDGTAFQVPQTQFQCQVRGAVVPHTQQLFADTTTVSEKSTQF